MLKNNFFSKLKKATYLVVAFAMAPQAFAETSWPELIEMAPHSKNVVLNYDGLGYIEMDAIELPNGKFRLTQFSRFLSNSKPRIYVDLPGGLNDVEQQCKKSLADKKPFKAVLKYTVNPFKQAGSTFPNVTVKRWTNSNAFNKGVETLLTSIDFDNPYTLGPVKVEFSRSQMTYSRIPTEPEYGQLGLMIRSYYLQLLNAHAQSPQREDAVLDLTNMNGFACDLMLGNVQLKITQTATFTPGSPARYRWIPQDDYIKVYKGYWSNEAKVFGQNSQHVTNDDRAFLLGLQGSPIENSVLFRLPKRLQQLIASLTFKLENLSLNEKNQLTPYDLMANHSRTDDLSKPNYGDLDMIHELLIGDEPTFTKTIGEMSPL